MEEKCLCVSCRFCDLRINFDVGSHYVCLRTGETIRGPILLRPACGDFLPPAPVQHWGP